ncbi:M20/M25/M40 family metallo-hydrolase [Muricoccus pecuniae]|uniref:Acetylornithine deacetylase/succinyl-diaminopimelate desuccinylase-like protein n=1 Tax=Muricoccus pecuniae TaxID=693023 RepID=A0A840YHB8_9PROT|nr:M20/M25/M40 family metallo-hydrolase [Roseomonas pecuniae]MBB5695837.1 acetylornithine deacetylase/succinyl-diaminopimelate desuccinylase-like protein [Roseomonas pecuniae]
MSRLPEVLARLDSAEAEIRGRYFDFLRIPSVSAQPDHAADCRRAAAWLVEELRAIGCTAEIRETRGQPAVVAYHPGPGNGASPVLYYGHYDVQPAEPFELWTSPPFEPTLKEGPNGPITVARGAVDDKGQVMTWLAAMRAWHEVAGGPPVPVRVLVEGEEEIGSPSLDAFLDQHAGELKQARAVVVSDTNMWDPQTPAISARLRGMAYAQIDLYAASRDLHSGLYGGMALNPINLLSKIVAELTDANGRIQLPGFYDAVPEVGGNLDAAWDSLGFDEGRFLGDIGLSVPAGEKGLKPLVRQWARPTCDVNGIWGGYTGPGSKTVIAAEAHAKVSFRLVGDQDPEAVLDSLEAFVKARVPADARVEVQRFASAPPVVVPEDSDEVAAARRALAAEYGREAVLIGSGGSIPVVESFRRILGLDSVLMGFGLNDDQVHSPNEKFDWACLMHGARSHARLLAELGA